MTQEDKDLVLKDMCSRVPYGLRLWIKMYERKPDYFIKSHNILSSVNYTTLSPRISIEGALYDIEGPEYSCGEQYIKPYLRPMSSMTENEFQDLKSYSGLIYDQLELQEFYDNSKCLEFYLSEIPSYVVILVFDWLNKSMFDYRGLIPRGLALEAPKDMY